MSEALRLAEWVESDMTCDGDAEIVAELRRLVAENETLKAELAEQARVNGMGGEREARLMAELERKSDAIQRLWKERDELRTLNAGLVEALRWCIRQMPEPVLPGDYTDGYKKARAALAKVEASNG